MPRRYPPEVRRQVVELARSGTKVAQLAEVFGVSEASIYTWLKQERIDRGEIDGLSTDQALGLAAAKRRIRQLETELAVARKVNEVRPNPSNATDPARTAATIATAASTVIQPILSNESIRARRIGLERPTPSTRMIGNAGACEVTP
jgi:transposase-like protein